MELRLDGKWPMQAIIVLLYGSTSPTQFSAHWECFQQGMVKPLSRNIYNIFANGVYFVYMCAGLIVYSQTS